MTSHSEVERKYTLAEGQELPSLATVATPGPIAEFDLVATYYDAPDYRLTRAKQVIRRREGGNDDGWHLKLPGGHADERHEVHAPLGPRRPPPALRQRIEETLAEAPLLPVAVLRTHRIEQQLLSAHGAVLALTTVDQVESAVGGHRQRWREAEVELVTGDPPLLDAVERVLAGAGIPRSASPAKIGQALADALAAGVPDPASAGAAVLGYAGAQVGVLQAQEAAVRVDGYDAVHRSRVATRRLRSTLRTFGGVLPDEVPGPLRAELRWHAEKLGAARDAEVLRERLLAALDQLPAPAGEPVTRRIATALADAHAVAHAALVRSMESPRYEQLHDALERFLAEPAREEVAAGPAEVLLPPMLGRVVRRVRALGRRAAARPSDLTRWHEVRKAAKAARYGAEVLVPVLGEVADGWRGRWEAVTEGLGAVQDCVVAMAVIDELAVRAVAEGLPVRPFDDLRHAQDEALRQALRRGREALATALAEADPGGAG